VILAHHGGEQLVLAALAGGGTSVAAGLAVVARTKLTKIVRWLHRP
jgi:hypothetical protein